MCLFVILLNSSMILSFGIYEPYYVLSSRLAFTEGLLLRGFPIGRQWGYGSTIIHPIPHHFDYFYG